MREFLHTHVIPCTQTLLPTYIAFQRTRILANYMVYLNILYDEKSDAILHSIAQERRLIINCNFIHVVRVLRKWRPSHLRNHRDCKTNSMDERRCILHSTGFGV
ncbi:hypothetical protein ALC57_04159 [Trachymyrmex cornetzi]|uniref:Uncharacterized protein n=1 Tax=Trachymyrmex cornetzi TaxID=471704 RepID=A0A195EDV2_9HYME|nr:hypothetical protein ALC57_04159 [Trachymyrmex cornetzi]